MNRTHLTYALRTKAVFAASEPLLRTIGGGKASNLILSDYSKLYGLLRALRTSVGSRLFRVYTLTNNNTNFNSILQ